MAAGNLRYQDIRDLLEEFDDFFPTKLSTVMNLGAYAEIMCECLVTVIKKDGERAGFVAAYFDEKTKRSHINFIVMKDKFKGQGLEKKLLAHLEEMVREKDCTEIDVMIRYGDRETIELYEMNRYQATSMTGGETFFMCKELG